MHDWLNERSAWQLPPGQVLERLKAAPADLVDQRAQARGFAAWVLLEAVAVCHRWAPAARLRACIDSGQATGLVRDALLTGLAFASDAGEAELVKYATDPDDSSGCRSQAIRLLAHQGNHRSVSLAHEAAKELVAFEPGSSIEALTQQGWGPGELEALILSAPTGARAVLLHQLVCHPNDVLGLRLTAAQRLRGDHSPAATEVLGAVAFDPGRDRELRRACLTALYDAGRPASVQALTADDPLWELQQSLGGRVRETPDQLSWRPKLAALDTMLRHFWAATQLASATGRQVAFYDSHAVVQPKSWQMKHPPQAWWRQ